MMSSKPNRRQKGKQKSDCAQKPTNQLNFNKDDEDEEVIERVKVRKLNFNTLGKVDDLQKMISAEQVTKPSTSKSSRRKGKKSNSLRKPKHVKQPTVNWLDLPSDVMANILSRIGVFGILDNVQKVCTTWHQICKEPVMWRAVSMDYTQRWGTRSACLKICKHIVDRSQGQMVDISIKHFCDDDLLRYIADRSTQLRRLEVIYFYGRLDRVWGESLKKLSLLEDLSLENTKISHQDIEDAGHNCPLLKTLKINNKAYAHFDDYDEESVTAQNVLAVTIGKNLPELRHLELIGNTMRNTGLKAILDGCHHLESLDLRRCLYIDLKGDLGKRCSEQIEHLKLPHDSLEGYQHLEVEDDVTSESDYCYGGLTCSDSDVEMDYNTFLSML
uniref:putative F-box/LRR-repeat protein 23 n=1 Tax=Erigeron canadensis TaxID=72917 RepID=UPI001CB98237|nr:putative F-box/LRR-repeat protein 23 [Erigeron canadensis]XP_043629265.1 putative F-box/LRR-repeat protein 23 [Erigeron canadensis]